MINSVTGLLRPELLGRTLIHEHFICSQSGWYADYSIAPYKRDEAFRHCVGICRDAKSAGVQTIVDCSPNDLPRDPILLKMLSEETGINIICVTGLYYEKYGAPAYWKLQSAYKHDIVKAISELFIREITAGIQDTGIKAGAIKVASAEQISPYEESVFKAAVVAQKATGVPILTHTQGIQVGLAQAALFEEQGANMDRVLIGHVSNSTDYQYHSTLAAKTNTGFDRFGLSAFTDDRACIENVARLVREGYARRVFLSQDIVGLWLGRDGFADAASFMKDWRIDHVCRNVIPALKEKGLTERDIDMMMVDNPRRLLAGE